MKNTKLNSIFVKVKSAIFFIYKPILFKDIRDLKFSIKRYSDIVVNNNLNSLKKIRVFVPKSVLISTFNDIQFQYIELSGAKEKINRKNKQEKLIREYNLLLTCGTVLSVDKNNKDITEFLRNSRIKAPDLLKWCNSEMKMIRTKLDEIKALNDKEPKQKKLTIDDYASVLAVLNKNNYAASWDMPMIDFIKANELYKREVEENKKQIEKLKNRK